MNELKRKNTTVTIHFDKERIISVPFERVVLKHDSDGNILELYAGDSTAKKVQPKSVETKKAE